MSTNVSLANAGTSLNFDGQALQNQQEAEIEREEQLQQNELRQLLSNAFDDLDDDILSVGSSEGDSVNISHASVQDSFRRPHSPVSSQQDGGGSGEKLSATSDCVASYIASASSPSVTSTHGSSVAFMKPSPLFLDSSAQSGGSKNNAESGQLLYSSHRDVLRASAEWSDTENHYRQQNVPYGSDSGPPTPTGVNTQNVQGFFQSLPHGSSDYPFHTENQHYLESPQFQRLPVPRGGERFAQFWGDGGDSHPSTDNGNGFVFRQSGEGNLPSHTSDPDTPQAVLQYGVAGQTYSVSEQHFPSSDQHFANTYQRQDEQALQLFNDQMRPEHNEEHFLRSSLPTSNSVPHHESATSAWGKSGGVDSAPRSYVPSAYGLSHPQTEEYGVSRPQTQEPYGVSHTETQNLQHHNVWFKDSSDVNHNKKYHTAQNTAAANRHEPGGDLYEEDYRVQYRKKQGAAQSDETPQRDTQQDFLRQEGSSEETQLSQLQMLYRSRGRQIEDLSAELEKLRQESGKERRMLKHQLSVATGEKEGVEQSLKESQKLLQEAKDSGSQVSSRLQATEAQLSAMKEAKDQLSKKLQSAETTIENLTHQLAELQESDSLAHARNQHEAVVATMQQRFDREILALKEKLDSANETISEQTQEISNLRKQLNQQTQLAEQAQISRGDTINQLTRSLEESQRRCQALLEASSSEEMGVLKVKLQQALLSKSMSDNMCASLQSEVQELKEQLSMMESASSLGALSHSGASQAKAYTDDSMADLGIRKTLDFGTPDSTPKFDGNQSSEELITSLRRELERCLHSNKQKRALVVELQGEKRKLQQQMSDLQEEIGSLRTVVESQKVKLKNFEERFGDGGQESAVEGRLRKDVENLQREKQVLAQDIDDYKKRLSEVSSSEERLTEINRKLNQQIAQMVREHDEDKRESIDRCRRTCEDAHKTARENLERSLRSEFFADKQELIMKYEKQLNDSREELQHVQEELDRVKQEYIESGMSLSQQESKLQASFSDKLQAELRKLRESLEKEKEEAVRIETERLQSEREQLKEQLETELADKVKQQADAQESKQKAAFELKQKQAVEEAVKMVEKEWSDKLQQQIKEMEQCFAAEKATWEKEKQASLEKLLTERLDKERTHWQVQTDREALDQVDMAVEAAKRQWADETRQELLAVTAELEKCSAAHKAELEKMEEKWQKEVSEKQMALEQELKTRFQDTLKQEVERRLSEQKSALKAEAETTLKRKLTELENSKREEFERRLHEERKRLEAEASERVDAEKQKAVEAAHSQWEVQLQEERRKQADTSTQEVTRLRSEVTKLQAELKRSKVEWEETERRLVHEKDEERRKAVASVRAQCEEDYRKFMEDNKATLDSALAAARQEHQRKMEEVVARHKEELSALRAVEQELRQALRSTGSNSESSPSQEQAASAGDSRLARKVEKLKKEVSRRDELLRQADAHMEQEIQRLRESLAENYTRQREKDSLRAQAQYTQAMQLSQKERTRLERQLETIMEERRQEKQRHAQQVQALEAQLAQQEDHADTERELEEMATRFEELREEKEDILTQLQDTRSLVECLSAERDTLASQLEEKDSHLQEERSRLTGRLTECQAAIKALDSERAQLKKQLSSVVEQHGAELSGVQQKLEQTKSRLRQVEAALLAVNKQHREDVQKVTDSMTAAHQQEVNELHEQLAQMQKKQDALIEEMEEKHHAEKQNMMEQVRRQAQRALAHTPTQTDTDESLCGLKDQYMETVHKIKDEVMSHISQSNERAALAIKSEVRMERQRTIQHLRRRCRSRLRHMLKAQNNVRSGEDLWRMVDSALDSLFDSVSSSLSATPSTSAGVTPRSSEEDAGGSDIAMDTDREPMNLKDSEQEARLFQTGNGNTSSSSGAQSVGAFGTPQSMSSDRYALPSALGKVELFDQGQSDCSLTELHGSGVFFPLEPDETASVTDTVSDSEHEFKQPWPPKSGKRGQSKIAELSLKLSQFSAGGGKRGRSLTQKSGSSAQKPGSPALQAGATKHEAGGRVSKEAPEVEKDVLFSPKMHRVKGWVEHPPLHATHLGPDQGVHGAISKDSTSGWRDVDVGVWTEAVGSTNLWQAYTDLKDMELGQDMGPRRQLHFQWRSFMDSYTDNADDIWHGEEKTNDPPRPATASEQPVFQSHATKSKATVSNTTTASNTTAASNRRSALVSKSGDFTRKSKTLTVRYKSMEDLIPDASSDVTHDKPVFSQMATEEVTGLSGVMKLPHTSSPDVSPSRGHNSSFSHAPQHEGEKAGSSTVPSKVLLNPKNFLSRPTGKPGGRSHSSKADSSQAETLDSMMARLGFTKRLPKSTSQQQEENKVSASRDRNSDSFLAESRYSAHHTQAEGRAQSRKSDSFVQENTAYRHAKVTETHKSKSRTMSADSSLHSHPRHHSGPMSRSSGKRNPFSPSASSAHSSEGGSEAKWVNLQHLLQPEPSREPAFQKHGAHSRTSPSRHRSDLGLVQRSLEEREVKDKLHSGLSHGGRAKSRSEQALHVLSEALELESGREGREAWGEEGGGGYHYTPLQRMLPPTSPSVSLLSTYSVSEGDLRF